MAYKQKTQSIIQGTSTHKSAVKSAMTYSSPKKANASNAVWSKANEASKTQNDGVSLNDLVAKRKTLTKGSNDYNINQNAINKAMGNSKRYDVEPVAEEKATTPTVTETRKDGSTKADTKTVSDPNAPDFDPDRTMDVASKYRKDGSKKSDVTTANESTYNAKTGEGSSGMGETDTKTRYKKSGEARRRQVSTGDMGTDNIGDDAKRVTKTGKRNTKVKTKAPGVGTTKTKTRTKGRKAGQTVTKVREKGQLFGRKVKPATNNDRNDNTPRKKQVSNRSKAKAAKKLDVSVDSQAASEKAFYDNARPKSAADIAKAKAEKEAGKT